MRGRPKASCETRARTESSGQSARDAISVHSLGVKIVPVPAFLKEASHSLFELAQLAGIFIVPDHYYVPLTSTRTLRATRDEWNHPVDISRLPMTLSGQRDFLVDKIAGFRGEYIGNSTYKHAVSASAGLGYGYIEAQALHGFVRATKPSRVIEVGSGVSTICMLHALSLNEAEGAAPAEVTCIEPYPSKALRDQPVRLISSKVEQVDLEVFDSLKSGDLLFIDSSHALRPCGDVQRVYLEIFPRLKSGVLIHVHDIFIPFPFQRDVDSTFLQWMETALLIAMLNYSSRYEIIMCQSYLHYADPGLLGEIFPEYRPASNNGGLAVSASDGHFPSSTYLRVN